MATNATGGGGIAPINNPAKKGRNGSAPSNNGGFGGGGFSRADWNKAAPGNSGKLARKGTQGQGGFKGAKHVQASAPTLRGSTKPPMGGGK